MTWHDLLNLILGADPDVPDGPGKAHWRWWTWE